MPDEQPRPTPGNALSRRPRPYWWPEGETWPPASGDWRRRRRRFARRLVRQFVAVLAVLLLILVLASIVGHLFHESGSGGAWRGSGPPWFVVPFVVVLGAFFFARFVRRTAAPLDDVMDAAGRLAAGDYSARVIPGGPSEIRELAHAFNAMAERLQTDEVRRRALLADVAHELRTPLAIIRGNAEGLLDGVYVADAPHLEPIIDETEVMSRLLDDLATLSTAEAGTLSLHREPVDSAALIDDLVTAFAAQADRAQVELKKAVPDGVPPLLVDPLRIRQVLTNMLTNALHHTPAGGSVTVAVAASSVSVIFAVVDTGSGIQPDQMADIFERFRKSPGSRGMGLGLAIAKQLVEAHGGSIDAESAPGRGTTIRFSLPFVPPVSV